MHILKMKNVLEFEWWQLKTVIKLKNVSILLKCILILINSMKFTVMEKQNIKNEVKSM